MIPDTDLIAEIHRLADGESPPTKSEMKSDGEFAAHTYHVRFGSWNDALRAAGCDPNRRVNVDETELLDEIRHLADSKSPLTRKEMNSDGKFCAETYRQRFGSWWQAVVQAGCTPVRRQPLTGHQFKQMVAAAHDQQKPRWKLVTLLHLFTGLPPEYLRAVTAERVTSHASGTLVTIPGAETQSGDDWQFKLPATWDNGQETELPDLLTWYLDSYGQVDVSPVTSNLIVHRAARDADIDRPTVDTDFGPAPDVTAKDLRATGGVRMARNGAPARRIRRHLGIEHTGWEASVEDFFLWLYVHKGYEHPEYDPPDVVLDPVR